MATATLQLTNRTHELEQLVHGLSDFCSQERVPDDILQTMRLALEEVVTNVIHHGCKPERRHTIDVRLSWDSGEFTAIVADDGRPFDPLAHPEPNTELAVEDRPIGGLGVHFVKTVMDHVEYARRDGKNIVTLSKKY